MKPYDAQVNIVCVDGMVEAIQGSDVHRLRGFLIERDHEGSVVSLNFRESPEGPLISLEDVQAYSKLNEWVLL